MVRQPISEKHDEPAALIDALRVLEDARYRTNAAHNPAMRETSRVLAARLLLSLESFGKPGEAYGQADVERVLYAATLPRLES